MRKIDEHEIREVYKLYTDRTYTVGRMTENVFVKAVEDISIRRMTPDTYPSENKIITNIPNAQAWELTYRLRYRICEVTFEKVLQQAWKNLEDGCLDWRDVNTVENDK